MKTRIDFQLAHLHLTLAFFKGQDQGHVQFNVNISKIVTDRARFTIVIKIKYEVAYELSIIILKCKVMHIYCEYIYNGNR